MERKGEKEGKESDHRKEEEESIRRGIAKRRREREKEGVGFMCRCAILMFTPIQVYLSNLCWYN